MHTHQILGLALLVVTLVWSLRGIKAANLYFSLFTLMFAIVNFVGLLFSAHATDGIAGYSLSPEWLTKAGLAGAIFLVTAIIFTSTFGTRPRPVLHSQSRVLSSRAAILISVAIILCDLLIVRYLALAGLEKLAGWSEINDRESAYAVRYSYENEEGQGLFSSSVAAGSVVPTLVFLLLYFRSPLPAIFVRLVATLSLVFTIIRMGANLQRSGAILQATLIVGGLIICYINNHGRGRRGAIGGLLRPGIVAFLMFNAVGILIYNRTDSGSTAIYRLYERAVIIPAHTAALYYGFFPEPLEFRGMGGIFGIPVGSWTDYKSEDTSLKLVGYLANGWRHNANANFLATGYSGAGWLGVLIVSMVVALLFSAAANLYGTFGAQFVCLMVAAHFNVFFALCQSDIAASYVFGGGIVHILAYFVLKFGIVGARRTSSAPGGLRWPG